MGQFIYIVAGVTATSREFFADYYEAALNFMVANAGAVIRVAAGNGVAYLAQLHLAEQCGEYDRRSKPRASVEIHCIGAADKRLSAAFTLVNGYEDATARNYGLLKDCEPLGFDLHARVPRTSGVTRSPLFAFIMHAALLVYEGVRRHASDATCRAGSAADFITAYVNERYVSLTREQLGKMYDHAKKARYQREREKAIAEAGDDDEVRSSSSGALECALNPWLLPRASSSPWDMPSFNEVILDA